ncbi:uncharacterized [Tachysurus ichikawai]
MPAPWYPVPAPTVLSGINRHKRVNKEHSFSTVTMRFMNAKAALATINNSWGLRGFQCRDEFIIKMSARFWPNPAVQTLLLSSSVSCSPSLLFSFS